MNVFLSNELPSLSIAKATNRKTVVAVVVVPVHAGVVVVQVAVPRVVRSVLRRRPEVGVVARVVEPVVPVAGRNGTKARSLFISSRSNVAFAPTAVIARHFNWSAWSRPRLADGLLPIAKRG